MLNRLSVTGLSPPARGNHLNMQFGFTHSGPIPASAGEPHRRLRGHSTSRAYPRQRGGTRRRGLALKADVGLSPPARGNQVDVEPDRPGVGPIPASAGEPRGSVVQKSAAGAYPRQRGGTRMKPNRIPPAQGLSPPARGNHCPPLDIIGEGGPIPASAGEPVVWLDTLDHQRAYPRQRGGTQRPSRFMR